MLLAMGSPFPLIKPVLGGKCRLFQLDAMRNFKFWARTVANKPQVDRVCPIKTWQASVPIPKFVSIWGTLGTNFGIERTLANL